MASILKTQDDPSRPTLGEVRSDIPRHPTPPRGVSGRVTGGATGLADFNLSDLAARGREQLEACQAECERLLATAQKQGEQILIDADARGHAEGLQRGLVDAQKKIDQQADTKARSQLQTLHNAVAKMHTVYDDWMRQYANVLTATAIAATEKILQTKLDAATKAAEESNSTESIDHPIVRWADAALHSTRSASRLTLAVHPDTLAVIGRVLDELLAHPELPEQSTVVPDETLAVGDVVVRQDGGEIRAGLNAQLERLREELEG